MSGRERRRQDKAILDHLTTGPIKPERKPPETKTFDEADGRELDRALDKRWTPGKDGGLPEF